MNRTTRTILAAAAALSLLATIALGQATRSRTFPVTKGGMIELSTSMGDVRLHTSDKSEVVVNVDGLEDQELQRVRMTQSGNNVRVSYRSSGSHWGGGNVIFDISVPTTFDVDVTTSGGDVRLEGTLTGKFNATTAGGDIKLGNINGGPVEVTTSGGDIIVGNLQGDGKLHTAGGDIKVGTVGGELEVKTSGGDIDVKNVGKSLEAKTAGGDIVIGDVGGEARVATSGGEIRVGKVSGTATLSTAGGDVNLDGASGKVKASTAGGDIRLRDISGTIDAKTAGGEVDAELVPSGKGKSNLVSAGGTIRLAIPENAKATIEATIRIEGWGKKKYDRYQIRSEFAQKSYTTDTEDDEIRAVYEVNGGGDLITVRTSNADIVLSKLRGK